MNQFSGKVAVVTGGASGIGEAICGYLAGHGAKVLIADRNLEQAGRMETEITANGGYGKAVQADVSNPDDVQALIDTAMTDHGRIDYLFNNAGISVNGEFQDMTLEHWKRVLDVNLWGVVHGCRSVYPIMMKQRAGHIINTASLAGLIPGALTTAYHAGKHAVVGFSLTLRAEARLYGIRVSVLCPGYLRTNIQASTPLVSAYMNSEKNRAMEARMKFLTPGDCIGQIMKAVARNRGVIVSPGRDRMYWWLNRIAPGVIPSISTRIIEHMKANA